MFCAVPSRVEAPNRILQVNTLQTAAILNGIEFIGEKVSIEVQSFGSSDYASSCVSYYPYIHTFLSETRANGLKSTAFVVKGSK